MSKPINSDRIMKSYTAFLLYNSDFSILTLFIESSCEANVDKIFHLGIIYTLIQQILCVHSIHM